MPEGGLRLGERWDRNRKGDEETKCMRAYEYE